jgi:type II secretory ATPase GspE/PulE/Tfp pilus assembly ATPase PilB-like protein
MPQFDDTFEGEHLEEIRRKEEENLIRALAVQNGYEYIDLRGITINPTALFLMPEEDARKGEIVPFETVRKRVSVAVRNPDRPETQAAIQHFRDQGYTPTIFMTPRASLEHGWTRYSDQKNTQAVVYGVMDINTDNITQQIKKFKTPESVRDHILETKTLNNVRRVSETLETVFAGAIALGASDIHIEPEVAGVRLRYRLDGVLRDIMDLDIDLYSRLISRLKLLSGMILNIRDEAQDGRFTFTTSEKEVEVRSSIIPGASGEAMVMRLLDPTVASFNLEQLGLNDILYNVMVEEIKRPNGLIVTTGPTGSGKTTALYAFLRKAHTPDVKIITIENPVEYKVDDIVQTQVSDDYTFESGLRAILRQDPDIIMVGEVRDREVAETAIHAAQTGHLVFTTLHTNSAVGAFPRLIDLGVDYRMIGSSVNIVLGQRLVRVLCEHCKKEREATEHEAVLIRQILATHPKPPTLKTPITLFDSVGCEKCNHTGFKGRQGVYEAIRVDEKVEEAIINDPREHIILKAALSQGIPSMAEDGIEKVLLGRTSFAELQRVVDLTTGRHSSLAPAPTTEKLDDDFLAHVV